VPTDDELKSMYDDGYFSDRGGWVCGFWKGGYLDNEENLRREARDALAELGPPGRKCSRLLEVGAAGGFFLDEARRAGYDVVGIELNSKMAEFGRRQLDLDLRCELFETAPFEPESFDVVVAQDVLEHVREPELFVRRAAELLRPGGVFFVRGPLEQSLKDDLYLALRKYLRRRVLIRKDPPFHLQGFARRSFQELMHREGLQVAELRVWASWPSWKATGIKEATASLVETVTHLLDDVRGGGEFMMARVRKPA
jgi:SAM-dependent methyltransferase